MTFKTKLLTLLCALAVLPAVAQDELINLELQARVDYMHEQLDGEKVAPNSGFKGRFLNIYLSGTIDEHFSYSYRQRLNKEHLDRSFFDATDWIYLTYAPSERWSFSAGKQVLYIGGWEYDRAPIDIHFYSEQNSHIACYQMGISATHTLRGGRDRLTLQLAESPFSVENENLYGLHLMWAGDHGTLRTLYSVSAMEYLEGEYIWYIALGHRLALGDWTLELDLTNRAGADQTFLLRDCTATAEAIWAVGERVNLVGKVTYDVNRTRSAANRLILPGTELTRVGGGIEFYPLKANRAICLHANYCRTFGANTNPVGVLQPKQGIFDVGVRWRMNLLRFTPKQ